VRKITVMAIFLSAIALQGCTPDTSAAPVAEEGAQPLSVQQSAHAAPSNDPVIARLNGNPITFSQIQKPLIEGYGLNILLNVVQLQVAKNEVARAGLVISPEDIKVERDLTLAKMFTDAEKADYELLFKQFLEQQHLSEAEFDLVLQTNAHLRKLAEPLTRGKITEPALEEAFRQLYGETIQCRHIQLGNMQELVEAKRRLAEGQAFQKVAQDMSRNARTAALGGELPPFSRQAGGYPQAFKDAAFALKEGEVSDAVQAEGAFHLIKLEHRIAPKAVKFEDVKESIREDLNERLVDATVKQLRAQFASDVVKGLVIDQPVLKQQYDARITQRDQQIKDRDQIKEQFERERQRILDRAATQPTTATSTPAAPEVARPPASQSVPTPGAATDQTTAPTTKP